MRTEAVSGQAAVAKTESGKKNQMMDQIKRDLVKEGFQVLGSRSDAESDTVAYFRVTGNGSKDQKLFRYDAGVRTDISAPVVKSGTPHQGDNRSASFVGANVFTRGGKSVRVTGSFTDKQGKPHSQTTLVSLTEAFQIASGKSHSLWAENHGDPGLRDSLAQKLSYELGRQFRVRTVGEDGNGNLVMTAFNRKDGSAQRVVVTPGEGELKYKVVDRLSKADMIAMVRKTEIERGHKDIKDIALVGPTAHANGAIFKVSYETAGKKPRQFEVDFGHPNDATGSNFVMHYSSDSNSTDRHTIQLVEKFVKGLLAEGWIKEAHRMPSLTNEKSTTVITYGQSFGESKKPVIHVADVAIDRDNRTTKSTWKMTGAVGSTDRNYVDFGPIVTDLVSKATGKPAFLGSHLKRGGSSQDQNGTLPIITHNGDVRVHSGGKDFIVNMPRLLAGEKTGLIGPDTSAKKLRTGAEVDDVAPAA